VNRNPPIELKMSQMPDIRPLVFPVAPASDVGRACARMVVVSAGRAGAGATTIAVHLAAALTQEAQRVVLVDADIHQADAAARAGVTGKLTLSDVIAGRRSIHEAIQIGPAGMQIVPGSATPETRAAINERSISRLLRQLRSLMPHADWLIVDAGSQPSELMAQLWGEAHTVMLVSSPDAVSVMDTYALVKTLLTRRTLARPPALVINKLGDSESAADVHRRIDQSCRRFLGLAVDFAAGLPDDASAGDWNAGAPGDRLAEDQSPLQASIRSLLSCLVEPEAAAGRRRAA
jgi:flagellar biosynthesis protein FlhG